MAHKGVHSRGYLPHWDFEGSLQGITFRLADSVPAKIITEWRKELQTSSGLLDPAPVELARRELHRKIAKYEDAGYGACLLGEPICARIVQEVLLNNHGRFYKIIEWCIMPNHVHVLVRLMGGVSLGIIVKGWKATSAIRINQVRGTKGSLWKRDYHDRFIRDMDHFHAARNYIRSNPVVAGLCEMRGNWKFSSAGERWNAEANGTDFIEEAK